MFAVDSLSVGCTAAAVYSSKVKVNGIWGPTMFIVPVERMKALGVSVAIVVATITE